MNHSYADLYGRVAAIQQIIKEKTKKELVAVVSDNTIDVYGSIIACWFSGKGFVPLHSGNPPQRNKLILEQAGIDLILCPKEDCKRNFSASGDYCIEDTSRIAGENKLEINIPETDEKVFCILFTSGSTGQPKGVPMTLKNIASSLDAFFALDYSLTSSDKFLQMFEFSFDMSMLSYLPAFCLGASIFPVSFKKIKYLDALNIMHQHAITFAMMVPSTLSLLQPYFSKINLPELKYAVLGGEPFPVELAVQWSKCIPNARIINISGPAEITMACMAYEVEPEYEANKSHNGILAFGIPWKNTKAILVDEEQNIVENDSIGELCFAGDHVMNGYFNLPEINKVVFLEKSINGKLYRFYRTGDMAFFRDGIYYTCGRKDSQVKIQGHKVELEEVEFAARKLLKNSNVFALSGMSDIGTHEIFMVVLSENQDEISIKKQLQKKLPPYMIPYSIKFVAKLPYNENGKIDRIGLKKIFE